MKRFVVLIIAPCLILSVATAVAAQDPAQSVPAKIMAPSAIPISVNAYRRYDFTPGETILFADDFTTTPIGESPRQWEQLKGHAVVSLYRKQVSLLLTDGDPATVSPRITKKHNLGPRFTIEFDTMMELGAAPMQVFFDAGRHEAALALTPAAATYNNGTDVSLSGPMPEPIANQFYFNMWQHIAIAVNDKELKVYVDQFPVLIVPDMHFRPDSIRMGGIAGSDNPIVFREVRIGSGPGLDLTGKKFTEARVVAHGITFDPDTATLRPQSMGTINQIRAILIDNPELKLEIDAHTDNSGGAAHDLILSQQRADLIRAELANLSIVPARLVAKGFGDTKPIASNDTPEGKANNRRIEFVKIN